MKSKFITKEEPKSFKPFTIEITAETIEDARLLWHLFDTWYKIKDNIESQGYSVYKK